MNRNELKQMLSQVDEQYIAALVDAEETTSEAAPITQKSRRFKGWAAAAAIVCVIGVGGGCLALRGSMGVPPASEVISRTDGTVEERADYDLIWEVPEDDQIIEYTLDAGGKTETLDTAALPFAADELTERRAGFYFDESGTVINAYTNLHNDERSLDIIFSDEGSVVPNYMFADVSEDADRSKPAIHIHEISTSQYELFYLHDGVGITVETNGYTAEEAEGFAAALLRDGASAAKFYEDNSCSSYFFRDISEITTHRNEFSLDMGGKHLSASGTVMPYPESLFTDASTNIYCTADGTPAIAQVVLTGDSGRYADIVLHDHGDYLSVFPIPGDSAGLERNGISFYGFCSAEEEDYRELYFVTEEGIGCSILCQGIPDAEIIALADSIIENKLDPAALNKKPSMEERDGYVLLWEETALTKEADHSWGAGGKNIDFTHCPMPFEIGHYTVHGTISCSTDGDAVNARVAVSQDGKNFQFTLSDKGKFFTECCEADLSRDAGFDKPVILILEYFSGSYQLRFEKDGIGMMVSTDGFTAEEAEAFAVALLNDGISAAEIAATME